MILMFGAEKGGVAKTRLSTNFAAYAVSQGINVVLLDTDPQGSSVGFVDIRREDERLVQFPVFSLPQSPAREIASLAANYDLVIVDIGAQNYRTMLECAQLSDLVAVPCGADQSEIDSTFRTIKALRQVDPNIDALVILTRVPPGRDGKDHRSTVDARDVFESEGIKVFKTALPRRDAWISSGKTGRSVVELKGKERSDKAADELTAFYKEVVKIVSKKGK